MQPRTEETPRIVHLKRSRDKEPLEVYAPASKKQKTSESTTENPMAIAFLTANNKPLPSSTDMQAKINELLLANQSQSKINEDQFSITISQYSTNAALLANLAAANTKIADLETLLRNMQESMFYLATAIQQLNYQQQQMNNARFFNQSAPLAQDDKDAASTLADLNKVVFTRKKSKR